MDLYLIRHGEALSKTEAGVGTDAERPLVPQATQVIARVAETLRHLGVKPERLLTSPLVRARQTAELIGTVLRCVDRIEVCQKLSPEQDAQDFIEQLRRIHANETVLAIGHQPFLGRCAMVLVCGEPRDGLALSPGGICWIGLPDFPRSVNGVIQGLWNPESMGLLTRQGS